GFAGFEGLLQLGEGAELGLDLVVGGGGLVELFHLGVALLDGVEVCEEQLGVDDVDVMEGVGAAGEVGGLGGGEAADDVKDGVGERMWPRNWLPRPSPLEAPSTRPAMSMNSMAVGTSDLGLMRAEIFASRPSGTVTVPVF